ncbi:MAG TPA: hypothetical protein VE911_10155 [Candidatus Nitrosopolaris sp.]|nr:hypothetical protein [Candidatus Nitrosopolaris sp.]
MPAGALVAAIGLQIVALLPSLRISDDDEDEYRTTVRWFIASAVLLLISLLIAIVEFPNVANPR